MEDFNHLLQTTLKYSRHFCTVSSPKYQMHITEHEQ